MRSGQTAADGPLSDLAPTAPRRQAPFWASVAPPPVCRCGSSQRAPGYPPEQTPGPPSAPNRLRSLPGPRPQPAHPCETGSPDYPSPEGRSRPNPPDRQHPRPSLRIPGSPVPLLCGVARSRRAGQINWARLAFLHLVVAVVYQIGGTTVTKSSVQPRCRLYQPGTNIRTDRPSAARQARSAHGEAARIGHARQLRSGVSSQTVKLLTNSDQPPCDPPQRTLDGVAVSIRTFSADPWSGDLPDIADCRQLCGRLALVAKTGRQIAETIRTGGDMMRSL